MSEPLTLATLGVNGASQQAGGEGTGSHSRRARYTLERLSTTAGQQQERITIASTFTPREKEVVRLISLGCTVGEAEKVLRNCPQHRGQLQSPHHGQAGHRQKRHPCPPGATASRHELGGQAHSGRETQERTEERRLELRRVTCGVAGFFLNLNSGRLRADTTRIATS